MHIDFFNTYIAEKAQSEVNAVLQSTMLSEGKVTAQFEKQLIQTFGFRNVVTLNSGTTALHLALDLCGVQAGDEVIIPAQTFVATGLAVLYCKAKPVFVDINYEDGNISLADLKTKITDKTKAVICVHWGGNPCDMSGLKDFCKANHLFLIDDAAHALGATYQNDSIANHADISCYSFQAIKHLTTGDGGAIVVKDQKLYEKAIQKKWFGIDRNHALPSELGERQFDLTELGYKYHLNNYAAALGLANLDGFLDRLKQRHAIVKYYRDTLSPTDGIQLFTEQKESQGAYWLFGLHVQKRLDFIRHLKAHQIPSSVVHQRIDKYSILGGLNHSLVQQAKFDETQIHIPIHDAISMEIAAYICDTIKKGW